LGDRFLWAIFFSITELPKILSNVFQILTTNGLGFILGDFSPTLLVTLLACLGLAHLLNFFLETDESQETLIN
jgi:hypothetical protein